MKALFLCGYPRSGTTLLLTLLDAHPNLLVFPEETTYFNICLPLPTLEERKRYLLEVSAVTHTGHGSFTIPFSGQRDYSSIDGKAYIQNLKEGFKIQDTDKGLFTSIFTNWKKFAHGIDKDDLRYFVEKTPKNEIHTSLIDSWFSDAHYIHIIRDPRDTYASYRKKHTTLTPEEFSTAWKRCVRISLKLKTDARHLVIRYEDLINDPQPILKSICNFLDIPFHPTLLTPTLNTVPWKGNSMFGQGQNEDGKIHVKAIRKYAEHLTGKEIAKIEGYCLPEMKELAYEATLTTTHSPYPLWYRTRKFMEKGKHAFKSALAGKR